MGNGIDTVQYHAGESRIISTMSADMTNSDTNLNVTNSEENRSAKFKNPQNKQGIQVGEYTGQK